MFIFQVEDQNFALFNYVTEMNNQVEGLQESIAKLRTDIKEAKGKLFTTSRYPTRDGWIKEFMKRK